MALAPTPYMGITLPVVSQTLGPLYASEVNTGFSQVDAHTHLPGSGQYITSAAIQINADLTFANFQATALKSAAFADQGGTLGSTFQACVYNDGGDVWWNNGSGTAVQITSGTSLAATSLGGISGLPSGSAGASFNTNGGAPAGSFKWLQATNQRAVMDCGPIKISDTAVGSSIKTITLKSPTSLASSYSLTLPIGLPGSSLPLLCSSAGALSTGQIVAAQISSTAAIAGTQLSSTAAILGSQLSATAAIAGTQLAASANIAGSQLSASAGIANGQLAGQTQTAVSVSGGWTPNGTLYTWTDQVGMVHVSGSATYNSGTAVIFTLAGVSIGSARVFPATVELSGSFFILPIEVDTSGNVSMFLSTLTAGTVVFFDTISFLNGGH